MNKRRVVTMGGGGFSMEPDNTLMDDFFISLSDKKKPKICFIATASGDSPEYTDRFYLNMKKHNVEASHLHLYNGPQGSLRDFVLDKDIFYVGGGNTRNLLILWREWGLDKLLFEAYKAGKVLGGISAGSICWYEQGVTDSIPGALSAWPCLGLLKGSNCPHYDGEVERRPSYHRLVLEGMKDGIACDDGVAAVFEDEKLIEFVSSRPNANAYSVKRVGDQIVETVMKPRFLGQK